MISPMMMMTISPRDCPAGALPARSERHHAHSHRIASLVRFQLCTFFLILCTRICSFQDYARMSETTEETASPDLSEDGMMSEDLSNPHLVSVFNTKSDAESIGFRTSVQWWSRGVSPGQKLRVLHSPEQFSMLYIKPSMIFVPLSESKASELVKL